jgi:hypothetical protein
LDDEIHGVSELLLIIDSDVNEASGKQGTPVGVVPF